MAVKREHWFLSKTTFFLPTINIFLPDCPAHSLFLRARLTARTQSSKVRPWEENGSSVRSEPELTEVVAMQQRGGSLASVRCRAGTQSSQVRPQGEGEQNPSEKQPGLSENPSQAPAWRSQSSERSWVSLRSRARPQRGPEPGLYVECSRASVQDGVLPQRSKFRPQGGPELGLREEWR